MQLQTFKSVVRALKELAAILMFSSTPHKLKPREAIRPNALGASTGGDTERLSHSISTMRSSHNHVKASILFPVETKAGAA